MSCKNCDCFDCDLEREQHAKAIEMKERCVGWNWDGTPSEVASYIRGSAYSTEEWLKALADFGFPQTQIEDVRRRLR